MHTPICLRRRHLIAAAAFPLLPLLPAYGGPRSCYRAVGSTAATTTGITLVLIDSTTVSDTQVVKSFSNLISKSLRRPGERLLVASFAGLTPGQFPDVKADVLNEPAPSDGAVESNTLDWTARMQGCLERLRRVNVEQVSAAIRGSIGMEPGAPYSEIVAALRWAMYDFLPNLQPAGERPTIRLVVYSDGDQNSRSGASFYKSGVPREINAAAELRAIDRPVPSPGTAARPQVDVWWVGIGLQPPGSKVYVTPRAVDERQLFWSGVLRLFGAHRVHLGLTVPDDGF